MRFARSRLQQAGTGEQILSRAGQGKSPDDLVEQVSLDERSVPERLVLEQLNDQVGIAAGLGFDGPPQEQWDVQVVEVFVMSQQVGDDGQAGGGRKAASRCGQLAADFGVGFAGRELGKSGGDRGRHMVAIAQQADGPESDVLVVVIEQFQCDRVGHAAGEVQCPECFESGLAVLLVENAVEQGEDTSILAVGEDSQGDLPVPLVGVSEPRDEVAGRDGGVVEAFAGLGL